MKILVFTETMDLEFLEIFQDQQSKEREKQLSVYLKNEGLSITTKANLKALNFLDIQLDLINSSYQPYRKPNDNPMYIDINSNRPPNIKKQIPKSISKRICELSSKKEIFNNNMQ